jgi:hypothetical protein
MAWRSPFLARSNNSDLWSGIVEKDKREFSTNLLIKEFPYEWKDQHPPIAKLPITVKPPGYWALIEVVVSTAISVAPSSVLAKFSSWVRCDRVSFAVRRAISWRQRGDTCFVQATRSRFFLGDERSAFEEKGDRVEQWTIS